MSPVRAKFGCKVGVGGQWHIQLDSIKTITDMGCPHFSQKQTCV